jgi:hypothetical protein
VANPDGKNQWGGFSNEAAYGAKKRLQELSKSAPISGAPVAASALNAPRRSQKQAVEGAAPGPVAAPATMPLPAAPPEEPVAQTSAQIWAELAAHPEASDLVKEYAARAQGR